MTSDIFKSGKEIKMTVGDASFKVIVGKQSKKDNFQKIEVPSEWRDAVKDMEIGSECTLTAEKEDQTFTQFKMILMEKQLDQPSPILILQPYKELKKFSELRKQNRTNSFLFTVISDKDDVDLNMSKENPLHGTISDINTGGCSLMTDHLLNVLDHLQLELRILDDGPTANIKCQIKSQRKSHIEKCFFYGLQFKDLGDTEIEMIKSYIENPNE